MIDVIINTVNVNIMGGIFQGIEENYGLNNFKGETYQGISQNLLYIAQEEKYQGGTILGD